MPKFQLRLLATGRVPAPSCLKPIMRPNPKPDSAFSLAAWMATSGPMPQLPLVRLGKVFPSWGGLRDAHDSDRAHDGRIERLLVPTPRKSTGPRRKGLPGGAHCERKAVVQ